jgi:hypothetical protein
MLASDRELLELAARALGAIEVETVEGENWVNLHFADGSTIFNWNPLVHGDDTLNLSVALELDIMHRVVGGRRVEVLPPGGPLTQEFYKGDGMPATCRAVTRAAAEVSKKLRER